MNRKERASFIVVSFALLTTFLISLGVGKYTITLGEVARILLGGDVKALTRSVFLNLRLPRTLMALLAGAGLGLAGSVYQAIFRNPLASPDIVGISSGANLGAAVVIVLLGQSAATTTLGSFFGGLAAVGFVLLLVRATDSKSTSTYVLSGIIISAIAQAFIMLLKYYADSESQLAAIEYWTMGSFASITSSKMMGILPYWILGYVGTMLLHRQVGLLSLNDDESRALGVKVREVRLLVLASSTL
ncbi:MAG: iron ABC transporter permease, partial [Spirochaetales bacterium]|nr:iron ABC transporter permease [Candidatus Physcosoma equi]